MHDNYYCTPLELYKLCSNVVVKQIYNKNEFIFKSNLYKLKLPEAVNEIIKERYRMIKHILNNQI